MSPDFTARCVNAWINVVGNPTRTCAEAAQAAGVNKFTFAGWVAKHHRGELAEWRAMVGVPLRATSEKPTPAHE